MNDQLIRELARKAGLIAPYGSDREGLRDFDYREFAKLILRECIQVSEAHAKDLESQPTDPLLEAYEDGVVNGIYEATVAIKEHFGVEE